MATGKLAQRNALAYRQGYRGKGGGEAGAYAAARKARATGTTLPTDRTAQPARKALIQLPGGQVVQRVHRGNLRSNVKRWLKMDPDKRVHLSGDIEAPNGSHHFGDDRRIGDILYPPDSDIEMGDLDPDDLDDDQLDAIWDAIEADIGDIADAEYSAKGGGWSGSPVTNVQVAA